MMPEREYLMKRVFPEIRAYCRSRLLELVEVDLRWGVTEEEAKSGRVIEICLQEIDKSRPFFIGMLGGRYGWVPGPAEYEKHTRILDLYPWVADDVETGLSVTEMEIQYGVLRNPNMQDHAFFYFRQETERAGVETDGEADPRLERLRARIQAQDRFPVREYSDPAELGEAVRRDLREAIDRAFPEQIPANPLDRLAFEHAAVAGSLLGEYPGHGRGIQQLDEHVQSPGPPLVVVGEEGAGKSTLAANWVARLTAAEDAAVFYHFVGRASRSTHYADIVARLFRDLSMQCDAAMDAPADPDALVRRLPELLERASAQREVVVVLDGLDKLESEDRSDLLHWLPVEFPAGCRVVLTTTPEGFERLLFAEKGYRQHRLEPLSPEERLAHARGFLEAYGKRLSPEQEQRLIGANGAGRPLVLATLLEELRIFGSFEELDRHLDRYAKSRDLVELFTRQIDRIEGDFANSGSPVVGRVLSALACATRGLSEREIMDCLSIPQLYWSQVYHAIEPLVFRTAGLLRLAYASVFLAVTSRYLADPEAADETMDLLIRYFALTPASSRTLEELPTLLHTAARDDELVEYLRRPDVFPALYDTHRTDLLRIWTSLQDEWDPRDVYAGTWAEAVDAGVEGGGAASLSRRIGLLLRDLGFQESGAEYLTSAADYLAQTPMGDEEEFVGALMDAADGLRSIESLEHALAVYRQIADYLEATEYPALAVACWERIGDTLRAAEELPEAADAYARALVLEQARAGEGSEGAARVLSGLGRVYLEAGDDDAAYETLTRALELGIRLYGGDHPALRDIVGNMAVLALRLGDDELAERYLAHGVHIEEQAYGEGTSHAADLLVALGDLRRAVGRTNEAVQAYRRAAALDRPGLPTVPRFSAANRLAELLLERGAWDEAGDACQAAFDMAVTEDLIEEPEAAFALFTYGRWSYRIGCASERETARQWVEQAAALFDEHDLPDAAASARDWLARHD
jgi:preprotein translocase subunit SecA/nephrocystin-3